MSTKASKSFRVGTRSHGVTLFPWKNSAGAEFWRFKSPITGKDIRRKSRSKAVALARDELAAIAAGEVKFWKLAREQKEILAEILETLPTAESLAEFLAWQKAKPTAKTVPDMVAEFIAFKVREKGSKTPHLRSVEVDLEDLATHTGPRLFIDLQTETLANWHATRTEGLGWKRRNDCRANIIALFNYARRMGEIDHDKLPIAQRLPIAPKEHAHAIRFANPAEVETLLREVRQEYRLWLVLGLFAGLRPEEIRPEKNRGRRGIDRGEIDDETETIYISREVAGKVGTSRRVPFAPNLREWLAWAGWKPGQLGPVKVWTSNKTRETTRLGKILDETFQRREGWPSDWLRHTYASHRNAILQNLPQLALELGNSPEVIQRHYNQPLPKEAGAKFFELKPADLDKAPVEVDFKRA